MQVTAIGGATIDVVVAGASLGSGTSAKQDVESITMGVGGGAVNASLACQACEARVRIVCAVGGDAEGEWLRSALAREGIDLSLVQSVAGLPTGRAVIHLGADAEARVFAQRGASTGVAPARALEAIGRSDLLYVTALSAQAEAEFDGALERLAVRLPRLAINPGMRQIESRSPALERLIMRADLVSMNEQEVRRWAVQRERRLPDDPHADGSAWMAAMLPRQGQSLLVTLGSRGAVLYDGGRVHRIEARKVSVRSTLGAGDAFGATFACRWAAGQPIREALEAARAYCVQVLQVPAANLAGRPPAVP
ncbi:carbohydrate kinase family protein [Acidovorax sp. GBBC 3334]|uniref:carbohydrate kinase family protein n=1 Tax=unclassified Acidovorax TaxID=2684926 RepID=UPI00230492E8|nr:MULTISPECIES: carbohydrate kinase family protein [unclassified Acidovorax]MDA8453251.1 carbohydrate kinase family protein [Acidovorax sp. GBBC 3334]MDA8520659.1 carbohydrate kinase family protein [Acidovorax sp. NCPPB 4044]